MSTFSVSNVIARLACCPIFANVGTLKAPILMSFLGFTSGANCEVHSARDLDGTSAALLCAVLAIGKEQRGKEDEERGDCKREQSQIFRSPPCPREQTTRVCLSCATTDAV